MLEAVGMDELLLAEPHGKGRLGESGREIMVEAHFKMVGVIYR